MSKQAPISILRDLFRGELSLSLVGIRRPDEVEFRLRDCDDWELGTLIFEGINTLCLSLGLDLYDSIEFWTSEDLPARFSWLDGALEDGLILVVLGPTDDYEEESGLPSFGGQRSAYIVCRSCRLEDSKDQNRAAF